MNHSHCILIRKYLGNGKRFQPPVAGAGCSSEHKEKILGACSIYGARGRRVNSTWMRLVVWRSSVTQLMIPDCLICPFRSAPPSFYGDQKDVLFIINCNYMSIFPPFQLVLLFLYCSSDKSTDGRCFFLFHIWISIIFYVLIKKHLLPSLHRKMPKS